MKDEGRGGIGNGGTDVGEAIVVRGLTKWYGDLLAVDHISFSVKRGEIFGLLGPNGAGKTTTIRMLSGLTRISEGEAYIEGHSVAREPRITKKLIGLVPDVSNLYMELSCIDNLLFSGEMYGLGREERVSRALELLEFFGLRDKINAKFKELSKGQKRRLTIASALIHRPRVLFLDEPTLGLDVIGRRAVWRLIRRLNRGGLTILLTTHNIYEAFNLCDRIAIINKGRITALGTPGELTRKFSAGEVLEVSFDPMPPEEELAGIPGVADAYRRGDIIGIIVDDLPKALRSIAGYAEARGLRIMYLSLRGMDAEEVFLRALGDDH